jgi:hypothetical protein
MADNKQLQQASEATLDEVDALHGSSQALVERMMAIPELNAKFARSLFLNWVDVFTPRQGQPTHKQQEPFQKLIATSIHLDVGLLLAPLTLSRKLVEASVEASRTAMQREK